jgi:hypothetical protein
VSSFEQELQSENEETANFLPLQPQKCPKISGNYQRLKKNLAQSHFWGAWMTLSGYYLYAGKFPPAWSTR